MENKLYIVRILFKNVDFKPQNTVLVAVYGKDELEVAEKFVEKQKQMQPNEKFAILAFV